MANRKKIVFSEPSGYFPKSVLKAIEKAEKKSSAKTGKKKVSSKR